MKERRLAVGTTLAKLASRLKVTKGYLSRLESNKTTPSPAMVTRLATLLDLDATFLAMTAGQLPPDIMRVLRTRPNEAIELLRRAFGAADVDTFIARDATASSSEPEAQSVFGRSRTQSRLPELNRDMKQDQALPRTETVLGDCFDWLAARESNSIHAVVTDPPYGLREYTEKEKAKLRNGKGGVWRIPPAFDGCVRSPLPRFTVLTDADRTALRQFFARWARLLYRVVVPGGHVFIATNPLVSHLVYEPMMAAGFEKRGEVIRLVQTLRGGDRPKNAHREFIEVTVMPRSAWEPWGLFRKPCEGRVQDNLRRWWTGGLRRVSADQPFTDVIRSAPTRNGERAIAPHPSLKPQAFMRQIVRASLPLGRGEVLDPFMGAGSTIAAGIAVGYQSIGIELDPVFFRIAQEAIPKLAALQVSGTVGMRGADLAQSLLF